MDFRKLIALSAMALFACTTFAVVRSARLSSADQRFLREAAQGDIAEIQSSRIVNAKNVNPDVKAACEQMIIDHTRNLDEIRELASNYHLTLPTRATAKDKALIRSFQRESGNPLEKHFVKHEVQDHIEDVKKFVRELRSTHNDEVRKWVAATIPTLETHQRIWQELAPKVHVAVVLRHSSSFGLRNRH